jgi:putative heme-binding domain-containing protein
MGALTGVLVSADSATRDSILRGLLEAAKGRQRLTEPEGWPAVYQALAGDPSQDVRRQARALALLFGSAAALDEVRAVLADKSAKYENRREALEALVVQRDSATLESLLAILADASALRIDALRALASYDDPRIPPQLIAAYPSLAAEEKSIALTTLLSRPASIAELLAAFDTKAIPAQDLTAPLARMIQGAKREDFDQWLVKNWGSLKQSDAEVLAEIERYNKFLGEEAILRADVKNGRAVYERTCSACHNMFGKGGHIGPELPGNFKDVDYLLQNILDPNAIIGRDFQQTFITTKDGNLLTGVVTQEDELTLTLKTLAATVTLTKESITKRELSPYSMMPAGLLGTLQEPEVRDLFLYLRQAQEP